MGVTVNNKTIKRAQGYHVILCPQCDHYRKVKRGQELCARCRKEESELQDRIMSVPRKRREGRKLFEDLAPPPMPGSIPYPMPKPKPVYKDSPRLRYFIAWCDTYSVLFLFLFWILVFGILPCLFKAKLI